MTDDSLDASIARIGAFGVSLESLGPAGLAAAAKVGDTPGAEVRFTSDYIFTPDEDRRTSVKYKAGWQGLVRQQCATKAIAADKAKRVNTKAPRRRKAP